MWNAAIDKVIEELDKIGHNTDNDIKRIEALKIADRITVDKDYWLCNCGKYHKKDFICERIK